MRPLKSPAPVPPNVASDPLLAFASETEHKSPRARSSSPQKSLARVLGVPSGALLLAIVVLATAAVTFALTRVLASRSAAAPKTGSLTVQTRPAGAHVSIDDAPRGVAPLTVTLDPGAHTINVRLGQEERVIPVQVTAGADIVRDLEMQSAAAPAAAFAHVSVVTDPPGARVTIDGQPSGVSPLTLDRLTAGEHTVSVASATGTAEKRVNVTAGHAASVVFSLPKSSGPLGGWLSVSAPFDVQVTEHDQVIGAGGSSRIMLAAGRHEITLVNRTLEYEETRRVEVAAGQTAQIRVEPPKVTINVNARPWAEVTLDGAELGQTPISKATVTVGTHQLVFRHPQLGERGQSIVVTAKGPNRVAVDLTK